MDNLVKMLLTPVSRFSILLSGIYSFMWGLWVFWPAWDSFPTSPIYGVLSWSGSEVGWGLIQMAVGTLLIAAAFESKRLIKWATFSGFVSWFIIACSFAIASPTNAGMWVTGYIAAMNAHFFLNVSRQEKISD